MLITRTASSNTTPDAGQGGNAVTGNDNNGHASTTVSQVANGNNSKTCIWETFGVNISGLRKSVTLKFDYTQDGSIVEGSTTFKVEVSVNNGSSYSTVFVHVDVNSSSSSSSSFALNNAVDISQIKVRDSLFASSTAVVGGVSLTASISNIKVEIDLSDSTFLD